MLTLELQSEHPATVEVPVKVDDVTFYNTFFDSLLQDLSSWKGHEISLLRKVTFAFYIIIRYFLFIYYTSLFNKSYQTYRKSTVALSIPKCHDTNLHYYSLFPGYLPQERDMYLRWLHCPENNIFDLKPHGKQIYLSLAITFCLAT